MSRYQILHTEDETYVKVSNETIMEIGDFLYDGGQAYRIDSFEDGELIYDGTYTISEIRRIYNGV